MKRAIFLAVFLALFQAGGALAQEPLVKLSPSPLEVPAHIGPLKNTGEAHKYDQPGMGVSYQYSMPGASLTVYVYDAEQKDLKDGADTIPACIEFEVAKQGVLESYKEVKRVSQYMVKLLPPEEAPLMREAVYEFMREGGPVVSYVWVTTVAGQFIKLRFTLDQRMRDEAVDARRAILSAFGTAIKPHLAPAGAEKKKGTSIGVNMNTLNGDLGSAGLMYPMYLSVLGDKDPEVLPVCGGELVPSYQTELGLYRTLFVEGEDGRKSKFGKQIVKAEQAGFLEELVWTELHRDTWGETPPGDLQLDGYGAWKKKSLKNFRRPALGTVSLDHPRPLPPEPAP